MPVSAVNLSDYGTTTILKISRFVTFALDYPSNDWATCTRKVMKL